MTVGLLSIPLPALLKRRADVMERMGTDAAELDRINRVIATHEREARRQWAAERAAWDRLPIVDRRSMLKALFGGPGGGK